jgi:MFS family permease
LQAEIRANVRHNMIVNVVDGGFFGFGLAFASFVTVIPLFVSTLTDSAVLIGLIASLHMAGWQLPQLITSNQVAKLTRYKPMVMMITLHERVPFFGLAIVALLASRMPRELALILTFVLVSWQSLGGGFAATAWQSMVAKIMPLDRRGTFYGLQSSLANLLGSGGAVIAGELLKVMPSAEGFALCFAICGSMMMISMGFLGATREPAVAVQMTVMKGWRGFAKGLQAILARDHNFRWFILARSLAQFAAMAISFYTVYAVRRFDMDTQVAGVMTAVLMLAQVVSHPVIGWLGDHWSHRMTFAGGAALMSVSALVAMLAPSLSWFYLVFGMAGLANATLWTTAMALNSQFGTDGERPYYLGLGNTLVAPATLLAPLLGGALASLLGFEGTFLLAAVSGLATASVLMMLVREPSGQHSVLATQPSVGAHAATYGE